jgi:shikimate kinase
MNIVLIGFMATGKSAVGRRVAERLGWSFFDTDDMIEQQTGHTIADLFAKGGEEAFRELESKTVSLVAMMDKAVIATGGGVPLRPANMDELERNGRVVLLTASPETILKRLDLGAVPRPLLAGADPVVRVKKLLAQRQPVYARNSLTVSTDGLDENQVVDLIVKWAKQEEWT